MAQLTPTPSCQRVCQRLLPSALRVRLPNDRLMTETKSDRLMTETKLRCSGAAV
jgi:hypothetical protein